MKDWIERLLLTAFLFISFSFGVYISNHYNQSQLTDLKSELKTKNKQIDGLHKQLTRTQYQLKKSREQNVDQTARIADLTRNGG